MFILHPSNGIRRIVSKLDTLYIYVNQTKKRKRYSVLSSKIYIFLLKLIKLVLDQIKIIQNKNELILFRKFLHCFSSMSGDPGNDISEHDDLE